MPPFVASSSSSASSSAISPLRAPELEDLGHELLLDAPDVPAVDDVSPHSGILHLFTHLCLDSLLGVEGTCWFLPERNTLLVFTRETLAGFYQRETHLLVFTREKHTCWFLPERDPFLPGRLFLV